MTLEELREVERRIEEAFDRRGVCTKIVAAVLIGNVFAWLILHEMLRH